VTSYPPGGVTIAERALGLEWKRVSTIARWRYLDVTALGLMVVTITAFNLLWVSLDSERLYWDQAHHLGDSLLYRNIFTLSHPLRFLTAYPGYPQPPFVYWVSAVFYAIFGTAMWVSVLSLVPFLAVLAFSTYGIGKTLWSRRVGLLSALFVVTSPLLVTEFKWYMLDPPITAMVALALFFLIKADGFADRRSSVLLGVACGLGLLTMWKFAAFLVLPAFVAVGSAAVASYRERSAYRLLNVGGALLITLALASVWYLPNRAQIRTGVSYAAGLPASIQHSPPVGSVSSLLWNFWNLVNNQLYLIPFIFLLVGVVYLFFRDDSASKNSALLLAAIGGYFAFTLIALKTFRYTLPMLPALAVIATHWLDYLRPAVRRWLTVGLVTYGILTYFVISFGTSLLPKSITIHLKPSALTSSIVEFAPPESVTVRGVVVFAQHGFLIGAPSKDDWHQDDIFNEIVSRGGGTFGYIGPADEIWFQTWGIRYYAYRTNTTWVNPPFARFLIVRGEVPAGSTTGFVVVKEYPLPYSGPLRLYERT
jgi:4-amino-4-deoxy-L-arabinose transferase-like glycosyltransferase